MRSEKNYIFFVNKQFVPIWCPSHPDMEEIFSRFKPFCDLDFTTKKLYLNQKEAAKRLNLTLQIVQKSIPLDPL